MFTKIYKYATKKAVLKGFWKKHKSLQKFQQNTVFPSEVHQQFNEFLGRLQRNQEISPDLDIKL